MSKKILENPLGVGDAQINILSKKVRKHWDSVLNCSASNLIIAEHKEEPAITATKNTYLNNYE